MKESTSAVMESGQAMRRLRDNIPCSLDKAILGISKETQILKCSDQIVAQVFDVLTVTSVQ